jgi:protoheme IX farnesyltransferase
VNREVNSEEGLRRLSWTGAALALGLIVLGGVVRITGSGLGCGEHWPRCNGEWFPPLDLPTMIEIGHRWVAALLSAVVFAVTGVALARHRQEPQLRNPAVLAAILVIVQVLLGAVTVKLALPPWVIITHLANAMLLLATLIVVALRASPAAQPRPAVRHADHPLVLATAALGFMVILFGAQVANFRAGLLCLGFPLCNGGVLPPPAPLAALHWTHRVLAFGFLGLLIGLVVRLNRRRGPAGLALRRSAGAVLAAGVAQVGVAAAMVLNLLPPALRALHLLMGSLVWAALVVMVYHSALTSADEERKTRREVRFSLMADFIALTKPRVISLLLVTTVAPMFAAGRGLPSWSLVVVVAVAGYLMAGGANAINMWFDRDIDMRMSRTRLRPVPAGRIAPPLALAFGIGLAAIAFGVFWHLVNPLSAWLALGGLLWYVWVYTVWLKRSSPQNIVIGGAAGAFPALVGWAAATGHLDLTAFYLFAIIFFWTPPHFWALALIKRRDYAKAGVPMLPVIRGEQRTRFEMLIYALMLIPLTLMPVALGAFGWLYAISAGLLDAAFLWYCVRLWTPTLTPAAWKLYRFSLLYLFLLFLAMPIDRRIASASTPARREAMRLTRLTSNK